jgi:hypothetical protein
MINAAQQLHNYGQNLWLGRHNHNPVLKPAAATGMGMKAA